MSQSVQIFKAETKRVGQYIQSLRGASCPDGVFDSAASDDFVSAAINQNAAPVPQNLQVVYDELKPEERRLFNRVLLDSVANYERDHGLDVPADLCQTALHLAYATTHEARRRYSLDSANSLHQDNASLQPQRAVVAILSMFAEPIPWGHYLPADPASNEAILAVMSHQAGGAYGMYAENAVMDGTGAGDTYISSARVHTAYPAADDGDVAGALTTLQTDAETCDAVNGATVKLIRGRTIVYVNGLPAAFEASTSGSGASSVSGTIAISGTTYAIGGTINTDTGVFALTTTPKLASTVPVTVEGFIDYERDSDKTPTLITDVQTRRLYAKPWRVTTHQSIDARTQMANELGLDPYSESVIAIQQQFGAERHYEALRKIKRLAANNQADHDFEWPDRSPQMSRAQIWQDFPAVLGAVSQQMAIDTLNHGITHLYVGKNVAAQFMAFPRDVFEPSGVMERPGVYRVGRLWGRYEVYYTPKVVTEGDTTAQILCVGRATDVARNPIVLGDAVPPTVVPLSIGRDLNTGAGFYARNFTAVNPFDFAARGAALINLTNLK